MCSRSTADATSALTAGRPYGPAIAIAPTWSQGARPPRCPTRPPGTSVRNSAYANGGRCTPPPPPWIRRGARRTELMVASPALASRVPPAARRRGRGTKWSLPRREASETSQSARRRPYSAGECESSTDDLSATHGTRRASRSISPALRAVADRYSDAPFRGRSEVRSAHCGPKALAATVLRPALKAGPGSDTARVAQRGVALAKLRDPLTCSG